jgi:type III secretion protein U
MGRALGDDSPSRTTLQAGLAPKRMADKNDGGDKTEKPTPKKLQDARKKGNVPKSKDLTSTVELLAWVALFGIGSGWALQVLARLMERALASVGQGGAAFANSVGSVGELAWHALLLLTALALIPAAAVGLLTEYLQAGPVFAADKLKPKAENMNPVEGVKRMFSMDNLVELLKSIAKTAVLLGIGWLVLLAVLPALAKLFALPAAAAGQAAIVGSALWEVTRDTLVWTVALFVLVALLDAAWQRHSFTKKMRMSMRDIKQETKDAEGDPYVKQSRRQAHEEWSQRNSQQAARQANVLVVNPTHVAIAIEYDRQTCPVPTLSAKGEDHVARAMREAAEEAGVPIVRNVELARDLLGRGEVGEIVPSDLFDIVAEVVLWAREVRDAIERADGSGTAHAAPGEDLTRYPKLNPLVQRPGSN